MSNPYSPGEFCWVDLNARSMEEAVPFYEQVFGWKCQQQDTGGGPPYGMFELDGQSVAGLGQMSDEMKEQGIPSLWNHYIQVEDCDATCARASELGGSVMFPAMDVMDAGRMAFLQDREGAVFAIWQPNQHFGAGTKGQPNSFVWNELATRDLDGAVDFYGQLLGWKFGDHEASPANYKLVLNGDQQNGGLMEMTEEWGDAPAHWTVYFHSSDANATAAAIQQAGGQIMHGPFDAPSVGRIAICSDPHGGRFNLIEFSEQAES